MIYLMIRLLGSLHASHILKLFHDMNVPKLTTNEIMHILHNQRAEKFRGIIYLSSFIKTKEQEKIYVDFVCNTHQQ